MSRTKLLALLAALLLPGMLLAPVWQLGGLGAGEDDVLYYYPARQLFRDLICAGQWPWLNLWTGLGRPFLADPQTAVFYPFTWLFVLLPPLWAYPVCLWLHYSLALWGMYRLLLDMKLGARAAFLGAIAFAFSGFMLAHRAHFTMQQAAAWAPWVFWQLRAYVLTAGCPRGTRRQRTSLRLAAAVAVIALQCVAGHIQIALLTAIGGLIFLAGGVVGSRRRSRLRAFGSLLARWLIAYLWAAGLFAIQWVPTLAYLRQCTRLERTYADFTENSWNPLCAVGWVLPMVLGQRTPNFFDQPYWGPSHQVEQFAYAGLLPLILAALALRAGWRYDRHRRPWVVLALFGFLLALGRYGPICPLLYWIPGSSLFRCPARAWLLVNLSIAALAAVTARELGARASPRRTRLQAAIIRLTRRPPVVTLTMVGVPVALVLIAAGLADHSLRAAALRSIRPWGPAVWVPLVVGLISLVSLRLVARLWRRPQLIWLLPLVTAIDLGIIGWTIDVPAGRNDPTQLLSPQQPADWMNLVAKSSTRLWVVTGRQGRRPGEYVDPIDKAVANTNILRQIVSLTDYGPLQPTVVARQFGFAPWGETPQARSLLSDTRWMDRFNLGWVLLCDEYWPPPADCQLVGIVGPGWRLYQNPTAAGWAFLEDPTQPGAVRYEQLAPYDLSIRVDTWPTPVQTFDPPTDPARLGTWPRLIISQLALPGWKAQVNGRPTPIEPTPSGLMAIPVPPGQAVLINCSYFPPGLTLGAAVSLICGMMLTVSTAWASVQLLGRRSASRAGKCSHGPRWPWRRWWLRGFERWFGRR